jgi:hypothetical protein
MSQVVRLHDDKRRAICHSPFLVRAVAKLFERLRVQVTGQRYDFDERV